MSLGAARARICMLCVCIRAHICARKSGIGFLFVVVLGLFFCGGGGGGGINWKRGAQKTP